MMKILIATDAWTPQVSGVVRSLQHLVSELEKLGHQAHLINPNDFPSLPCPSYPEIPLSLVTKYKVRKYLIESSFDSIHIATEGPIGFATRAACKDLGLSFTTAYHTKFPEYLHSRWKVPTQWTLRALRWFHSSSQAVMVATPGLKEELSSKGFKNLKIWSRGVDTSLFKPREDSSVFTTPGPHLLYVGRVAIEKNLEEFLSLNIQGTKHIVGDGPQLESLRKKFPDCHFYGSKTGEELARFYSSADVFVFPSKTDTFGLVLLEALASGTPIAAFPVRGPLDVIGNSPVGALNQDLGTAIQSALKISRKDCRHFAEDFSWRKCSEQFVENLSINVSTSAHFDVALVRA